MHVNSQQGPFVLKCRKDLEKVAQHWWDYTLPVVSMMLKNPEPWVVSNAGSPIQHAAAWCYGSTATHLTVAHWPPCISRFHADSMRAPAEG